MMEAETDILHEVHKDHNSKVLDVLKYDFPNSFVMSQVVSRLGNLNSLYYIEADQHIYTPWGNIQQGMFVSTYAYKGVTFVMVYSIGNDKILLAKILHETKILKFDNQTIVFELIHDRICPAVTTFLSEKHCRHAAYNDSMFWLPPAHRNLLNEKLPADVYLDFLNESHAQEVHKNWTHFRPGSESFIIDWITTSFGIGLFRKRDRKMVSWSVSNHSGGMFVLNTDPVVGGKGYATIIVTAMSKEILRRGRIPFACVRIGNTRSERLFESLGFEVLQQVGHFVVTGIEEKKL